MLHRLTFEVSASVSKVISIHLFLFNVPVTQSNESARETGVAISLSRDTVRAIVSASGQVCGPYIYMCVMLSCH